MEVNSHLPTVPLLTDAQIALNPTLQAIFDDIRTTRNSPFINNFWRALANHPDLLAHTWSEVKAIMLDPAGPPDTVLDPLTRELIYIAVSTANNCGYCIHSHTAAARARGLTDPQHAHLLQILALANQTNTLANALQIPTDPEFQVPPPATT